MIDIVDQLLWEWFSRPRKSVDKIVELCHMVGFCRMQLRTISASFTDTQQQNADCRMILALFF